MNVQTMIKSVKIFTQKHSPEILTGLGIAGMITSTVLAVKATPRAMKLIENKKREEKTESLTKTQTVKTVWKNYIPAAVAAAASTACLICSCAESTRRTTAIAAAYALSESALKTYSDKVVETIGEKKEQEIKEAIAEDKIKQNPVKEQEVILTANGETLCYDALSGRYFKSSPEAIRKAESTMNKQLVSDMYISLNDFYYELGLDGIKIGNELGWNYDTGGIDIEFCSRLTDDNTPCLVIDYKVSPKYDFYYR